MLRAVLPTALQWLSLILQALRLRRLQTRCIRKAHELRGARFGGDPRYIHPTAWLDASGGLTIGANVVMSLGVVVLTHDYAITVGLKAGGETPASDVAVRQPVVIGRDCFLGARAILLPGTELGDHVIVGAGAVVRGKIPGDSVVAGNPARIIGKASEWARRRLERTPPSQLAADPVD